MFAFSVYHSLLNGIKERMETRVKESLPKQLFLQKKIADDINDYLQEIDTFLAKFSITSQIEFQSFMAQCRLDHKKDRDDWTKFVSDVKNQHELTLEAVRGVPALTRGLMADMQEVCGLFHFIQYKWNLITRWW